MTNTEARAFVEPVIAAVTVTGAVTVVAYLVPSSYVAVVVALAFLAATWFFVFRHPDDVVVRAGLGLGGLVASPPLPRRHAGARARG